MEDRLASAKQCVHDCKVALRDGIEMGSTTIERIVQGKYEWRDMQYKKTGQNRVWDPGIT